MHKNKKALDVFLVVLVQWNIKKSRLIHLQLIWDPYYYFVGNKAKGRISKRVSGSKKCSFFRKFGMLCFFWNTRFEIHPFALLPSIFPQDIIT